MIKIDYEEGQKLIIAHICGVCHAPLTVAWGGAFGIPGYVLRCGVDPSHDGIEGVASLSQAYKRGDALPKELENVLEKKLGGRKMSEEMTKALVLTPQQKGEIKKFLESSFEGTLAISEADKAYALVEQGFDSRFHICIYHKKVTLVVDGWYWWARQDHRFSRIITNPITDESLLKAYGVGANEIGCIADLYVDGVEDPAFRGFGRASKDEASPVIKGSAVEHLHPYRLAEKRAEVQALRKFRPIGLPVQSPEELTGPLFEKEVFEVKGEVVKEEAEVKVEGTEEKPEDKPKLLTNAHAAEIGALKTKLKFTDAEYSNGLWIKFGKTKTEELTDEDAKEVIAGMMARLEKNSEKQG